MSSISFVRPSSPASSTTSHGTRRATFPISSFEPDQAFQMNPLSFHPPRTPRPSLTSQADMYSNLYPDREEKAAFEQEERSDNHDSAIDTSHIGGFVRRSEVWRDIISTSVGRDKALVSMPSITGVKKWRLLKKLVQYTFKSYLLLHRSLAGDMRRLNQARTLRAWESVILTRITPAVAGISLTRSFFTRIVNTDQSYPCRKCLILCNWLDPLNAIMRREESTPFISNVSISKSVDQPFLYPLLNAPPPLLLDLVNGIAEDISTCAK